MKKVPDYLQNWKMKLIIFLIFNSAFAEWEIPEELRPPEWLIVLSGGFSPLIGHFPSLPDSSNLEWLASLIPEVVPPSYSNNWDNSDESMCSFVQSSRRKCFALLPLTPCGDHDDDVKLSQFCLNFWRKKLSQPKGPRNEKCFINHKEVKCMEFSDSIVQSIYYDEANVHYDLQKISTHNDEVLENNEVYIYQNLIPDCALSTHEPVHQAVAAQLHTKFSLNIRSTIYILNTCTTPDQRNCSSGLDYFLNKNEICVCGECVILNKELMNENTDICPATLQLVFRSTKVNSLRQGQQSPNRTEVVLRSSNFVKCSDLKFTTVSVFTENSAKLDSIPRFYKQRGRFHCPSEISCLWEIFYIAYGTADPGTNFPANSILIAIGMIVILYFLSIDSPNYSLI